MTDESTGHRFEKLVQIMARLRGPDGCPWDKEQDFDTLKPMLVEEVYEVIEAIDTKDWEGVSEELGDLLLHIVFQGQLGKESGRFDIDTVIHKISEKLIRRHPHVFGTEEAGTSAEVIKNWEAIKAKEKADKGDNRPAEERSILDGIPPKLPALHEAHQISARVARVGFDWPTIASVFEKLQEEVLEVKEVLAEGESDARQDRLEDEVGDMFFVLIQIARHLNIDSESALKRTNRKFKSRFQFMEKELVRQGRSIHDSKLDEMETLWQRAKAEKLVP